MPARCQPDASVVAEHRGPAVPSLKYGASLERLVRVPSAQQPLKYFTLGKRLTMLARNVSMHYRLRTSLSLRPHAVLRTSGGQRTFFTVIHQGHEGWRLTLGQNPVKLDPGLRWYLPFIHTVHEVDMREMSADIKDLAGFTSDNVPVRVSGSLFFRVDDSYKACFAVHEFQKNVQNIGTSAMRSVIGHFNYDEVIGDRNRINTRLHDVIGGSIQKWGVDCTRFEVQNFMPSNRDVEKQLELQMQAERERRKQILDTQALINVAEGRKQKTILESEGALQAQMNEGRGLATQVEILSQSLTQPSGTPSDKDREMALHALVQLRRLEQLRAIASGPGNATYFFGDAAVTGRDAYDVENMERWKKNMKGALDLPIQSTTPGVTDGAHPEHVRVDQFA